MSDMNVFLRVVCGGIVHTALILALIAGSCAALIAANALIGWWLG